jgi:hypothetical protein
MSFDKYTPIEELRNTRTNTVTTITVDSEPRAFRGISVAVIVCAIFWALVIAGIHYGLGAF